MIPTPSSLAERRQELSQKIARERQELGRAYNDLATPFHYTDTALAGVRVVRKNGWLIALAPSVVSLAFSFFGWEKKSKPSLFGLLKSKITGKPMAAASALTEAKKAEAVARLKKPLHRVAGHAWSLFQIYRKIRPFFP